MYIKILYSGDERRYYGTRWMDGPDRLVAFCAVWCMCVCVCVCDGRVREILERGTDNVCARITLALTKNSIDDLIK